MATIVKFRKGNTSQNDAFTGAVGEISIDTTTSQIRVHDGVTAGGTTLARLSDLTSSLNIVDDTTPQLGGNLDVNGNSIVSASNGDIEIAPNGTGSINLNASDITIEQDLVHAGDTTNKLVYGAFNHRAELSGSTIWDINTSGIRLGGLNSRVSAILDEDTMSSNSATALITEQSAKAYVDSLVSSADGWVHISSASDFTGVASFDFTLDTATYDHFVLIGTSINSITDNSALRVRTYPNGGGSFDSGASDYAYTYRHVDAGSTASNVRDTAADYMEIIHQVGAATNEANCFRLLVLNANNSKYTMINGTATGEPSTNVARRYEFYGVRLDADSIEQIQFYLSAGNIKGKIDLYGFKGS